MPEMNQKDDSAEDLNRLYDALKRNNMNEAKLLVNHLRKIHHFTKKKIDAHIRILGQQKILAVSTKSLDASHDFEEKEVE